jgi:hypothetical protein
LSPQHSETRGLCEADLSGELQPFGADRLAASSGLPLPQAGSDAGGLDDARQRAFIDEYENLLNTMGAGEAVAFVDAVHPTHQVRPAGCWARKDVVVAVEQTTGRERLNIHGAINLETGQTQIVAVDKVNAQSFIRLLGEIDFNSLNSVASF